MTAVLFPFSVRSETLSDTISRALTTHPQVEAGKAVGEAARKSVWEQRAGFFPTVSASARAGRINADDDTTRANTGADAYSWLGEGNLTLTQPLFAGFSVMNRTQAAKERVLSAEEELSTTAEDLSLKAARAHLNVMRTKELLAHATSYMQAIRTRRENIDLMVREGAADQAELMQAEEIYMAARTTELGYLEAYRQAEAAYIEMTGGLPEGELSLGDAFWDSLVPQTIDEALGQASAESPRLRAADKTVSALEHETDAERGLILPRLDAELSYLEKDQDDDLGGELSSAQAMLKMSWNFSTGGGQLARVARGLEQKKEAQARRADTLRTVELEVRQKHTSMQIVDEQYGLYLEREKTSQSILDTYLSQFEGGQQSNLQLISAQAKLFEAAAARTDAYYRRLLARFELLSAMGRLRHAFAPSPQADQPG